MDEIERAHWLAAREGKLTASRMAEAMCFRKDGKPAAERTRLLHELLAERVTGSTMRHFVTAEMQHGIDQEPAAIEAYEVRTGRFVRRSVFYEHPEIANFGATPDGEVDGGGLIEVKCPTPVKFVAWTVAGAVPDEHKPQMIAQCLCTGREWVDFVAFDPRVRDARRQLFVVRYEPTAEEKEKVRSAAVEFLGELDRMFDVFTQR